MDDEFAEDFRSRHRHVQKRWTILKVVNNVLAATKGILRPPSPEPWSLVCIVNLVLSSRQHGNHVLVNCLSLPLMNCYY